MKLRSMQIKRLDRGRLSKSLPTSSYSKTLNCDNITEIDVIDDEFDPNEQNLTHERPVTEVLPDIPLPHASLQWEKTVYVAKWRHPLDEQSLLSGKINGQFQSVEDERPSQVKIQSNSNFSKKPRNYSSWKPKRQNSVKIA